MKSYRALGEDFPVVIPLLLLGVGSVSAAAVARTLSQQPNASKAGGSIGHGVMADGPRGDGPIVDNDRSRAVNLPASSATDTTPTTVSSLSSGCPPISVMFAIGSAELVPEDVPKVKRLYTWLSSEPAATVRIDGHADSVGAEDRNLALSHSRAKTVANLLEGLGLPKLRMTARGFGSFQPLEGVTEDSASNRRAEILIRGGNGCPPLNKIEGGR